MAKVDIIEEIEPGIRETEIPPDVIEIADTPRIRFDTSLSDDRRLRRVIFNRIEKALNHLPSHYGFVIYEAYRPKARQIALWDEIWNKIRPDYPDASDEEMALRCRTWVANPYTTGSGHQYGCAIDITIEDLNAGQQLDMGCGLQEFCDVTKTDSDAITSLQKENRELLIKALETEDLVNYPQEWWHFSYGDRLWAILTKREQSLYGMLPY